MKLVYKNRIFKMELNEMFKIFNCKIEKRNLTILAMLSHKGVKQKNTNYIYF